MKASLLIFAVLLLSVSCARKPPPTLIQLGESVAFRRIATADADTQIVETARNTTERFVTVDNQVLAEWVPIANSVSLEGKNLANAVTRQTNSRTEVLVVHTVNDISEKEISTIKGVTDNASQNLTIVTLTGAGTEKLLRFTVNQRGRAVAVIANGVARAVPQIVAPVNRVMVLSPEKIDKVRAASTDGTQ